MRSAFTKEAKPIRIVVAGAGFAGAYTFRHLHRLFHRDAAVHLVLINDTNHFLFTPLLHEVATGSITPGDVTEPLRRVLGCCMSDFHLARVERVATKTREVKTNVGTIVYDYLVVALGSEATFFDTPGAREHTFALKTLEDAVKLKNRLIFACEKASLVKDQALRSKLLTFIVVGGGPTGVELAAEMQELCKKTFARYYPADIIRSIRIMVIHGGEELVPQFPPFMRARCKQALLKKGVELRFNALVTHVRPEAVVLKTGEVIPADTVVWTAGVKAREVPFDVPVKRERGRLQVEATLQLEGIERVFVAGDMANALDAKTQLPLPQLAQVATDQALCVAENIHRHIVGKPLQPFVYQRAGDLISLGQWAASGEVGRFRVGGHLAWFLWRTVYLSKLLSWYKKLRVAVDWTLNIFAPRDITQVYWRHEDDAI